MIYGRLSEQLNKRNAMITIALLIVLMLSPATFWYFGLNNLAILALAFVGLSLPSIVKVIYLSIKHREWPKIVNGPSITWAGLRCQNCKEPTDTLEEVHEIVDRFEVAKVKVCPKCAKKIKKDNSMFAN